MTYAFTQDVPIDAAAYDKIVAELGLNPAPGFVVHLAIARPEGGLRYIDVWDTEADFEKFRRRTIAPSRPPDAARGLRREHAAGAQTRSPRRHPRLDGLTTHTAAIRADLSGQDPLVGYAPIKAPSAACGSAGTARDQYGL